MPGVALGGCDLACLAVMLAFLLGPIVIFLPAVLRNQRRRDERLHPWRGFPIQPIPRVETAVVSPLASAGRPANHKAMNTPKIEVYPTPADVAEAGAERVVAACRAALEERDTVALCLAGGSTPKAMYELLATPPWRKRVDWPRVEIFFGDERTVPPDHPDSNYAMAKAALLDHVQVPGDNVYRMKGELDPQQAAEQYDKMLRDRFGESGGFDLLMLGMGDDGHTLSLFPHTAALDATDRHCVANHVEKLDTWRLTITAPFANRSSHVLGFVTGQTKAAAVTEVLEGDGPAADTPIKLIDPGVGRFTLLLDAAAVAMDADDEE